MKNHQTNKEGLSPLLFKAPISCNQHKDADDDSLLLSIEPYSYKQSKALMFWIFSILSGGILFLFDFWFLRLHIHLRFSKAPISQASHLLIKTKHFDDLVRIEYKNSHSLGKVLTFSHHHLSYYYDGDLFQPIFFDSALHYKSLIDRFGQGIKNPEEVLEKKEIFGPCQINVPVKPYMKLLIEELLHPFNIFQIWSCLIWYWEDYWYYASAIVVITLISLSTSLIQTRKSMDSLHKLALRERKITVIRDNAKIEVSSMELVPGDLVEIPNSGEIPCDLVLISGGCIMEEGMLTGESVPVMKDALPYLAEPVYSIEHDKRHSLYEGTRVIQTRNFGGAETLGIVTRTGFLTMKGKLVRSILFPKPNKFKFYQDSMKFIAVLIIFTFIGFFLCLPFQISQEVPTEELIKRCLDLITVTIPPALPAAMTVGTAFAITRLRKDKIYCTSPPRVNVAGKIDTFCFDKTGTLTEDGMNLLGVHPVSSQKMDNFSSNPKEIENSHKELIECMACCHSLTTVNGELLGDTQDLMIFNSTKWLLNESDLYDPAIKAIVKPSTSEEISDVFDEEGNIMGIINLPYEMGILHIFHFTSKLKRMGVIVKNLQDDNFAFFMKGAPEVVLEKCNEKSIPSNLKEVLAEYTKKGYRVLACASKKMPTIKYTELRSLKLEEIENDVDFLGFLILQNKLKSQTIPSISDLHNANIKTIMATGDAVLTGICVARECGILDEEITVFLGEMNKGEIWWEKFQVNNSTEIETTNEAPWKSLGFEGNYALALAGSAFAHLIKQTESERKEDINSLKIVMEKCKVYARMSPEHKTQLVEHLQNIGYLVGMCGDGANDCGALKAADIGISLSESDSSIAAPFTSQIANISCVNTVLREGRCALTTSLQCFKFMALYSMIQFITVSMLYWSGSNLSDSQYMTVDLLTVLPLAICMSYTKSYPKLSKRQPTASLISVPVLTSVIGQAFIAGATQITAFLIAREMPFWESIDYKPGTSVLDYEYSYENSVLFLVSWFEYQFVSLAFSIGKPWKKSMWTNFWLSSVTVILGAWTVYEILIPADWARHLVNIKPFPFYFKVVLLSICMGYGLIVLSFEKFIVPFIDIVNRRRANKKKYEAKVKDLSY